MTQIHWINPVSGSFTTAADWSTGAVPHSADDAILDAPGTTDYTVTAFSGVTVNSIQTAPTATLIIDNIFDAIHGTGAGANAGTIDVFATLLIAGNIDNTGSISLGANSQLEINSNISLSGGGIITGQTAASSSIDLANNTAHTLTNVDNTISHVSVSISLVNETAGHLDDVSTFKSVTNFGTIENSVIGNNSQTLVNHGTINKSSLSGLSINFGEISASSFIGTVNNSGVITNCNFESSSPDSVQGVAVNNSGLIQAIRGETVSISNGTDNNVTGGTILANGGLVRISGETVTGGTLQTANHGLITLDGAEVSTTLLGTILIADASTINLQGTLANLGALRVASAGDPTILRIGAGGAYLVGKGALILGGSTKNSIQGLTADATLTNVDNTISGGGLLGNGRLTLVNQIDGVIDANAATALYLNTGSETVTNAGLIEATGAGGLIIQGTTIDGSGGGVIDATGSIIQLRGADIIGGMLQAGSGMIETQAGVNVLDGRTSAVTNDCEIFVGKGALVLEGTIDNNGRRGGSFQGGGRLVVGVGGATLSGGGEVFATISGASAGATLTNVDNKLEAGNIGGGQMALINQQAGVIDGAGATAAMIVDTGANTIINAGAIVGLVFIKSAVDNTGLIDGAVTVAGPVTNAGVIEGSVTITGAVDNTGLIKSKSTGNLMVDGAVSGAGTVLLDGNGTVSFGSSFSENVTFAGPRGGLALAQSQAYASTISGFSTTGGTSLDLRDIAFGASTKASYSGTASGGVLTVTDGTHTAHFKLAGDYADSTFTVASDGHGGTTVVDPGGGGAVSSRFVAALAGFAAATAGEVHPPSEFHGPMAVMLTTPPRGQLA